MNNQQIPGLNQKNMNLNINLDQIADFKCHCGNTQFLMVYNLKFVSPVLCGQPHGARAHVGRFACSKCGDFYAGALSPAEMEKRIKERNATAPKEDDPDFNEVDDED